MGKKIFLITFLLLPGCVLFGQAINHAANPVFIDVNTGVSVAANSFTHIWQSSPALHLNMRFPFYASQLEIGMRYIRFKGMAPTPTNSDFHSFFIHLGYSYPLQLSSVFQIDPTIRFGDNLMIFDQPQTYKKGSFRYITDPVESEFAYELALRNQLKITDHWYIHATISYNRTLTKFPLPLGLVSAGISYSFAQPQWLKNFLQ